MLSQSYFRNATPVLRAKHTHPEVRHGLVDRQRLLDRLDRGLSRRLTLVVAPAGYGKTTILAQWLDSTERPSSWLSLDPLDNDLSTFAAYLLAAVRDAYPDAGENLSPLLISPQAVPAEILADALIEDLATLPGSLILVLDDFHLVDDPAVMALMERLLQFLPSGVHLVFCLRADLGIPIARLRALGEVAELRAADLRFEVEEAQRLLSTLTGTTFDATSAALLDQRVEGWAIALQLAGLAMHEDETPEALAERFAEAGHEYAADYLMQEILTRQPQDVQDYLLRTSILERMSEPLAAAVTNVITSSGLFDQLWRANQLVVPLDERREWFRYHHLFRAFLRRRLIASVTTKEIQELHRRAAAWLAREAQIDEAIGHAVAADDPELAVTLVEANLHPMMNREAWQQVARWLDMLPASVHDRLIVRVGGAWVLVFHNKISALASSAAATEQALAAAELSPEDRLSLQAQIDSMQCMVAYWTGDLETSLARARRALKNLSPDMVYARGIAHHYYGVSQRPKSGVAEGIAYLQAVIDANAEASDSLVARMALGQALLYEEIGDIPGLRRSATVLRSVAERGGLRNSHAWADFGRAHAAYESNDLSDAERCLHPLIEVPYSINGRAAYESHLLLILTLEALRRHGEADIVFNNLQEFLAKSGNLHAYALVEAIEFHLTLSRGLPVASLPTTALSPSLAKLDLRLSLVLSPRLTRLRALVASGGTADLAEGSADLATLREAAEALGLRRRLADILALEALVAAAAGDRGRAGANLAHALRLGEPGRLLRTFVDYGPGLIPLLEQVRADRLLLRYVDRILGAFGATALESAGDIHVAPDAVYVQAQTLLTYREQEVVSLLAERLSDKEIAARLVVATNTVKKYTSHIYQKLGVNNRRAAVSKAERLGLTPTR